MISSSF